MSIFVKPGDVTMFQHKAAKVTEEKPKIDYDNLAWAYILKAKKMLDSLEKDGAPTELEDVVNWDLIDECRVELQRLINYEPTGSPTSAQFERDGGFGLSDAERNK